MFFTQGYSQQYHIDGFIKDSFTKEGLDSVSITMMTMDSTVVESFMANPLGNWQSYQDIKAPGKYIMKFERKGYYPAFKNVDFKYVKYRRTGDSFGEVLMRKDRMKKEVTLGDVVVTASKVKMVVKGDTIVYNADAFQLSSGSMLDKLIKLLPGVELDATGQIYLNGEKVASLLVNGDEFFNGDPKVALDNLPSYMVDKVKAYRKTEERVMSKQETDDMQKNRLPLVLDVGLKREYSTSLVGNAVVGGGTDNHHEARLFALRYAPNSHFAIIGNTNDVRGDSYYNASGQWQEPKSNKGDITTREAKIDYLLKDKDKKWKLSDNLAFKTQKREDGTKTSTTTFLDNGVFSRARSLSTNRSLQLQLQGTNSLMPSNTFSMNFSPNVRYTHQNNSSVNTSADFMRQLTEHYMGEALDSLFGATSSAEYRRILISSLRNTYYGKSDELSSQGTLSGYVKLSQDFLRFSLNGSYNNTKRHNQNIYDRAETTDDMSRYSSAPERNYSYRANIAYQYVLDMPKVRFNITPEYTFYQSYNSSKNTHYILDNIAKPEWDVDFLKSHEDSITRYIDFYNSYHSQTWNKTNTANLGIDIYLKTGRRENWSFSPKLKVRNVYDRVAYAQASTDTTISRRRTLMEPSFEFRRDVNNDSVEYHWNFKYDLIQYTPSILYSVNYVNDATPLVVRKSGYDLENQRLHWFRLSYQRNMYRKQRYLNLSYAYYLYDNWIKQAMAYDPAMGVRTYMPKAVDGYWMMNWFGYYQTPIDILHKDFSVPAP